ncbi:MAG: discoidin domain-containing protein [Candidatus Sericytochromatia bacterium]
MRTLRWGWGVAVAMAITACGTAPQPVAPSATGPEAAPDRTVLQYGRRYDDRLRPIRVYASSNYANTFARLAVNNDTDRQWASGGYQEPEAWLVLQFPGRQSFDYAEIKTGPLNRGAYYRFEVSNDGRRWRPVTPPLRNTSWEMERKRIDAEGRYLRVHFFNSSRRPMARFSIFEVDVFGNRGFGGPPRGGYGGYGGYDDYDSYDGRY